MAEPPEPTTSLPVHAFSLEVSRESHESSWATKTFLLPWGNALLVTPWFCGISVAVWNPQPSTVPQPQTLLQKSPYWAGKHSLVSTSVSVGSVQQKLFELIIYWCITNFPKTQWLKIIIMFVVQLIGQDSLSEWSTSMFTYMTVGRIQSSWAPGLRVSASFRLLNKDRPQLSVHWPLQWAAHTTEVCFFRVGKWEEPENIQAKSSCDNIILEVASHHFCHILFIRSKSPGPIYT